MKRRGRVVAAVIIALVSLTLLVSAVIILGSESIPIVRVDGMTFSERSHETSWTYIYEPAFYTPFTRLRSSTGSRWAALASHDDRYNLVSAETVAIKAFRLGRRLLLTDVTLGDPHKVRQQENPFDRLTREVGLDYATGRISHPIKDLRSLQPQRTFVVTGFQGNDAGSLPISDDNAVIVLELNSVPDVWLPDGRPAGFYTKSFILIDKDTDSDFGSSFGRRTLRVYARQVGPQGYLVADRIESWLPGDK